MSERRPGSKRFAAEANFLLGKDSSEKRGQIYLSTISKGTVLRTVSLLDIVDK
jgi:hypothetical protein